MSIKSRKLRRRIGLAAAAAGLLPLPAAHQLDGQDRVPRASQHGTVSQTITGTTIRIAYDRPTARGRELFGGLVSWGDFWTPGANWATTIEADGPFSMDGHELAAGRYSLWFVVGPEEWTIVISADDSVFHTERPVPALEAARYPVTPQQAGHYLDALTFYFPAVGSHSTTLVFQWGATMVPLEIEVPEYPHVQLGAGEAARYTGSYRRDDGRTVSIREEDGILSVVGLGRFAMQLVPLGEHRFTVGTFRDGELASVLPGQGELRFLVAGGRVTGFELWRDGAVRSRGARQ